MTKKFIECAQLIAIGCTQELIVKQEGDALKRLQQFIDQTKSWLFGYLTYDLKMKLNPYNQKMTISSNFFHFIFFAFACY